MGFPGHHSFRISMDSLIGVSLPMQRLYSSIQRARSHRAPALILGETGSGKELVARSIHFSGARTDQPFLSLDCTSVAPTMIEPELFGYAKDAFIGTQQARQGMAALANGGTLFLRGAAELPLKLQAKLFYAMQEQQFSPVGSAERFPFRARVMASSTQDLSKLVARGAFREDLYFHLSAIRIELPPLRERKPDIPLLASHFLEKYTEQEDTLRGISDAAMECLLAYSWPGNVMELERAVRWALSFAAGPVIEMDDLPPIVRIAARKSRAAAARLSTMQPEYLAIINALYATGGNRTEAAYLLQMTESVLNNKLQSYGL
jgi:two-component system response regulator HydG